MMKKVKVLSIAFAGSVLLFTVSANANVDHKSISGPFETPMEVTKTCLECHEDAADIMKTSHWTWSLKQKIKGKGKVERGKKDVINNFCIAVSGNWPRCTSCHISYGWKDASFDLTDETRIDCLVCHDTTGTYKKPGPAAGMPAGYTGKAKFDKKPVDLVKVAQNVGMPARKNCVSCHGYGGGGDNVKHGDIDSTISNTTKKIDVHMGTDGNDFTCQECHKTENHSISGNAMVVSPGGKNHIQCIDCHDEKPHKKSRLNKHVASVACQTCHIPEYAKGKPTKLMWDWSTAGQDKKGGKDEYGKPTYVKKKGDFKWGKNVIPVYAWYNGKASAYLPGEKINPKKVTKLNWPEGSKKDKKAKIYPFKLHEGNQIYDKKYKYFIKPYLWPSKGKADKYAFWKTFDWNKAATKGMEIAGMKYSGEYGFARTQMYWRLNHMVAPVEDALKCKDCHSKKGRLDWKALGYKGDPMKVKGAARM